jgi:hypothetical protein
LNSFCGLLGSNSGFFNQLVNEFLHIKGYKLNDRMQY